MHAKAATAALFVLSTLLSLKSQVLCRVQLRWTTIHSLLQVCWDPLQLSKVSQISWRSAGPFTFTVLCSKASVKLHFAASKNKWIIFTSAQMSTFHWPYVLYSFIEYSRRSCRVSSFFFSMITALVDLNRPYMICWTRIAECKVTEICAKQLCAHWKRCFTRVVSFNLQGARRTSGGNGGTATAKIKRIKTVEGSGRGRGRERGSRANAMTRPTGTKQSTGIAEVTTRTRPHLETASCSSASEHNQQPVNQPQSSSSWPSVHPPSPLSAGVLLLPVWFDRDVGVKAGLGLFTRPLDFIKVFFFVCFVLPATLL